MILCICNNVRQGDYDRYHLIGTKCGRCKMIEVNGKLMENDVHQFLRDLLDPEMYGHAVSAEVRDEVRKLLGMKPVETTQLGWNISEGA